MGDCLLCHITFQLSWVNCGFGDHFTPHTVLPTTGPLFTSILNTEDWGCPWNTWVLFWKFFHQLWRLYQNELNLKLLQSCLWQTMQQVKQMLSVACTQDCHVSNMFFFLSLNCVICTAFDHRKIIMGKTGNSHSCFQDAIIHLQEMRRISENLSHDSQFPVQESKSGPRTHEAGVLTNLSTIA